jgi:20S proteasome alpha/beta subunit
MTCIVYRDGVLASDSRVIDGTDTIYNTTKIYRLDDGSLMGAAGNGREICIFKNCYLHGIEAPEGYDYKEFAGIIIKPDGAIFFCETHDLLDTVDDEFLAIGSGRSVAIGALEMGASAEEAVEIAIKYNTYCGGPIQVLKLNG